MPQMLLPIFPENAVGINELLSFQKKEGFVYYFHGCMPIFSHHEDDLPGFRMFIAQLAINGSCKQVELVRAFGISAISVKRYVKKYRQEGPGAFFKSPKTRKRHVLTPKVLKQGQQLLDDGKSRAEAAKILCVKPDTFSKAVLSGRLVESKKKYRPQAVKANGV